MQKFEGIMEEEDKVGAFGDISASEDEGDQEKHEKLLDAIAQLDGKKRKRKDLRIEPSSQVSEFNLATAASKNQVELHELVGAVKGAGTQVDIKKKLKSAKNKKTLSTPLNKFEQERVERSISYDKNKKEVSKWLPIVQKNRQAEQLHFPLVTSKVRLDTTDQLVQKFQPRTPLELEVAKMLHGSDHVLTSDRMLTRSEERALKAMNLEEAKARRAELQKYRALLSYKEARAKRQNKIKSKKYHRILRKEILKKGRKALEDLKTSDPEAFKEKFLQLEKGRIEERMSLKHRGGSKKMAKQMMYGKYNKEARDNVQDMMQKNKELTEKLFVESDSESETEMVKAAPVKDKGEKTMFSPWTGSSLAGANPWMEPVKAKLNTSYKRPDAIVNEEAQVVDEEDIKDSVCVPVGIDRREKSENVSHSSDEEVSDSESVVDTQGIEKHASDSKEVSNVKNDTPDLKNISVKQVSKSDSDSDVIELISEKDLDELFGVLEHKKKMGKKDDGKLKKMKKKRKRKKKRKQVENPKENNDSNCSDGDEAESEEEKVETLKIKDDGEELMTASLQRKKTLDELEEWSDSEVEKAKRPRVEPNTSKSSKRPKQPELPTTKDISIDPKLVLTVETKIKNSLAPNVVSDEEDGGDADQRMTISEAFVDDDVMEEFSKDKRAAVDKDKPKDFDMTLPGWGDWGGVGLSVSRKKRKRFRIKAAPAPPRKDRQLDNVIISETKDGTIAKHQVNNLPFEYTNVKQFESSIRAPLGKMWNPETSFRELTKPKVLTRPGMIIDPMDASEKFRKQKGLEKLVKQQIKKDKSKIRMKKKGNKTE